VTIFQNTLQPSNLPKPNVSTKRSASKGAGTSPSTGISLCICNFIVLGIDVDNSIIVPIRERTVLLRTTKWKRKGTSSAAEPEQAPPEKKSRKVAAAKEAQQVLHVKGRKKSKGKHTRKAEAKAAEAKTAEAKAAETKAVPASNELPSEDEEQTFILSSSTS
jgi:hypothetical protein